MILNIMYMLSIPVNWLLIFIPRWHSLIQPFFHNIYMVVEVSAIVPGKKNEGNWLLYSNFFLSGTARLLQLFDIKILKI